MVASSIFDQEITMCRCDWCEAEFREIDIIIKDSEEFCPKCNEAGYLDDQH